MTRGLLPLLAITAVAACSLSPSQGSPSQPSRPVLSPVPASTDESGGPQPSESMPTVADCSAITFERALSVLRDAPSYSYVAEGRDELWEMFSGEIADPAATPSTTVILRRMNHGSYIAPDRFTEEFDVVYQDDIIEARRFIGAKGWVRYVGNMRWAPLDNYQPGEVPPNLLHDLVERQPGDWTGPDNKAAPGYCQFETSASDERAERAMTVYVDPISSMPVVIDYAVFSRQTPSWGAIANFKMSYRVTTDADDRVDEPPIDSSPVRDEEALYAFRQLYCGDGPCSPSILSQSHANDVDSFCVVNGGPGFLLTFEDGQQTETSSCGPASSQDPSLPTLPPPPPPRPPAP